MKNSFLQYLIWVDIFGTPVKFTINKSKQSKTILGSILTIISFISLLAFAIYNAEDFYKRKNPTVTSTTYTKKNSLNITINKMTFPFAIHYGNTVEDFKITGMKFFGFYLSQIDSEQRGTLLNFRRCGKNDFPMIDEEMYEQKIGNVSFCVDNLNYSLFNTLEDKDCGSLGIMLIGCNKTAGEDCKNGEDLVNARTFLYLKTINVGIDHDNLTHPFQYYVESLSILPVQGVTKQGSITIKKNVVNTDDGWFIKTEKQQSALTFDKFYN